MTDLTGVSVVEQKKAPFGSWLSPISASQVAAGALRLSQVSYGTDGHSLFWLEGRPQEGGRQVLVKRPSGGSSVHIDITPAPFNVRSTVHEYGGGAYAVGNCGKDNVETVIFSNFADQRIYRQTVKDGQGSQPEAITEAGPMRFADYVLDVARDRLLTVVEDHTGIEVEPGLDNISVEPINYLASVELSPGAAGGQICNEPMMLTCGYDFFAFPRMSPDGKRICYMAWKHPNMPWDESVLFIAEVGGDGSISNHRKVVGMPDVSVYQPSWGADGTLFYVSDESGYWQLRAIKDFYTLESVPVISEESDARYKKYADCEFGMPLWVFGQSIYAHTGQGELVAACTKRGLWQLLKVKVTFEGEDGLGYTCRSQVEEINSPYTEFSYLCAGQGKVAMLAGSANLPNAVVEYSLDKNEFTVVKKASEDLPAAGYLSRPEVIEFPTGGGKTAFANYYPPTNAEYSGSQSDKAPPLLVKCHGGPTGQASSLLALGLQYWTSRGFAVVDVNYGGSTGFGRAYRKRLNGNWGLVDVEDCKSAVKYLAAAGKADENRVCISGGSAGGYTVLCALTFTDAFKAGASHYGIGDLEALVRDTHKFEARYIDNLVGPYPFSKAVYEARSPLNHIDKLSCPVIFFQGLEDKVVPPNQAEAMVAALKKKKIPTLYVAYEGEQHGFRKAENIIRTLESELAFFLKVFKIKHEHKLPELLIENLD